MSQKQKKKKQAVLIRDIIEAENVVKRERGAKNEERDEENDEELMVMAVQYEPNNKEEDQEGSGVEDQEDSGVKDQRNQEGPGVEDQESQEESEVKESGVVSGHLRAPSRGSTSTSPLWTPCGDHNSVRAAPSVACGDNNGVDMKNFHEEFRELLAREADRPLSRSAAADLILTKLTNEKDDGAQKKHLHDAHDVRHLDAAEEPHEDFGPHDAHVSPTLDGQSTARRVHGAIGVHADEALAETLLAPCYFDPDDEEELSSNEILAATDEVEIEVAADTGAVAHVVGPKHLPGSIAVTQPEDGKLRNFVSANDGKIKNYGKANVQLVQEDGTVIENTFNVADVSRPLHSMGVIADTGKEILFTKGEAVVVPEGALSKFLGSIRQLAKYRRKGGLYVAKMKARNPNPKPKPGTASSFGRQGPRR